MILSDAAETEPRRLAEQGEIFEYGADVVKLVSEANKQLIAASRTQELNRIFLAVLQGKAFSGWLALAACSACWPRPVSGWVKGNEPALHNDLEDGSDGKVLGGTGYDQNRRHTQQVDEVRQ